MGILLKALHSYLFPLWLLAIRSKILDDKIVQSFWDSPSPVLVRVAPVATLGRAIPGVCGHLGEPGFSAYWPHCKPHPAATAMRDDASLLFTQAILATAGEPAWQSVHRNRRICHLG